MMKNNYLTGFSLIGTSVITIIALINKEITVFYMLYLFWWQALIEIIADFLQLLRMKIPLKTAYANLKNAGFLLGIYFVFIVVLFGIVFSFSNEDIMMTNFQVMVFQQYSFNLNILLFIAIIIFKLLRSEANITRLNIGIFTPKLIILHISIILGALVHFGLLHYYPESFKESIYPYILSAVPFLLLQIYFEWKSQEITS